MLAQRARCGARRRFGRDDFPTVALPTADGRYSWVATDSDDVVANSWLEERHGLLTRRVPGGCSLSSGWELAAQDDKHLRIEVSPVSSDGPTARA